MASREEPPQYSATAHETQTGDDTNRFKISRKPLKSGSSNTNESRVQEKALVSSNLDATALDVERFKKLEIRPSPQKDLTLDTYVPEPSINSRLTLSPESTNIESPSTTLSTFSSSSIPSPTTLNSSESSSSSYVQKAYREARHFAGGLIARPHTSTKHYTILRHSHGLVFYQGTSTTLAISIFADEPLPGDRTIWLQSKGWTGNTGMRLKALVGRNGNWHNVTPAARVLPEQLKPTDERAWQRDFKNFQKKQTRGPRRNHILRETSIVRIPADAGDGYFQLVLCLGDKQKVLCSSPSFRVLSTSTSPHSIKGASLSTLPLEIGAMALGVYAKKTAGRVVAPVTAVFQSKIQSYMPSFWTQEAVITAYGASGVEDHVNSTFGDANMRYEQARDGSFLVVGGQNVDLDSGPQAPYPLKFTAQVDMLKNTMERSCLPTIHVTGISETIYRKLHGYYFGWVRYLSDGKAKNQEAQDSWIQALISALPVDVSQMTRINITEASKRSISVHLLLDPEDATLEQPWIEVMIMGFIRPDEPIQRANLEKGLMAEDEAAMEAAMLTEYDDVSMAQSMLDHPAWTPQSVFQSKENIPRPSTLERVKSSYTETRLAAQRHVDRVPLHKVGLRSPFDSMKDKTMLVNGFYVVR